MTLPEFNNAPAHIAESLLEQCNASAGWYSQVSAKRPFASKEQLIDIAENIWQNLEEKDTLQAFEAHPMIGDVESLRKKYANTKALASGEQSGTATATDQVLLHLAKANQEYLEKFGFIFIVFATGKSALEMLQILTARLGNTREEEIKNAAEEQWKITLLRIEKLLSS